MFQMMFLGLIYEMFLLLGIDLAPIVIRISEILLSNPWIINILSEELTK